MGEATEPTCLVLQRELLEEEETLCASSSCFRKEDVSIPALLKVICHKVTKMKDSNPLPPGCLSQEEHKEVSSYEHPKLTFSIIHSSLIKCRKIIKY